MNKRVFVVIVCISSSIFLFGCNNQVSASKDFAALQTQVRQLEAENHQLWQTADSAQGQSVSGTPDPLKGNRVTDYDTSEFDDSQTVIISQTATNEVRGWLVSYTPELVLRCKEKQTEMLIIVGIQSDVESGKMDQSTVRVRFDDDPAL